MSLLSRKVTRNRKALVNSKLGFWLRRLAISPRQNRRKPNMTTVAVAKSIAVKKADAARFGTKSPVYNRV
jgi:hypothetical protein